MGFLQYRSVSISSKLVGLVVFSWLAVAVAITSFFVGQDLYFFRTDRVADLAGLARVLGSNCTAPLEFSDAETAKEVLSSLSARPLVRQAAVYAKNNEIFARYVSVNESNTESLLPKQFPYKLMSEGEDAYFFKDGKLELYVPIQMKGETLGTLLLLENLSDFKEKLIRTAWMVAAILAGCLIFAWLVSNMLRRYISNPILAMAEAMSRVRKEQQYSYRIKNEFTDELSVLAEGFNSMLDQVQQRDKQLLDAKRTAEEASRAKSTFLAQMSHEIRTPMNGVLGIASLLRSTELTERQAQFVRTISRSGEALLLVINDILDFSKIEAGKLEFEEVPFSLREVAEETFELLSEQGREKGLTMKCQVDSEVPEYVSGDPGRLRQVLMNLLGNGVKFTAEGMVKLVVTLQNESEQRVELLFKVVDSGIGIREDKMEKIFSAFSQADDSTTRKFGGTGLGLVISEQLVRLQGGTIGVESVVGEGSTFWFTTGYKPVEYSRRDSLEISRFSAEFQGKVEEGAASLLFCAHVLVVEDNLTNQIVTQGMLEKTGCSVEVVGDGLDAVAAVKKNDYDIIFMDCHMPRMDGYQASEEICRLDRAGKNKIPIIALTAHAMKGDQEQCLRAGMDDYLSKPCSESQIRAVLKKWLPEELVQEHIGNTDSRHQADAVLPGEIPAAEPGDDIRGDWKWEGPALKVLVVDDNDVNRDVASAMLETLGCEVDLVFDGKKAVAAVTDKDYDLIFMDCQMPVMDGFEATLAIRCLERNRQRGKTPIVAMTGNAMTGDRDQCLSVGMSDYICKPFTLEDLIEIVENWVSVKV